MRAVQHPDSGVWHLLGARGCGAEPDGEMIEGSWAVLRDRIDRDPGDRCSRCRWPPNR